MRWPKRAPKSRSRRATTSVLRKLPPNRGRRTALRGSCAMRPIAFGPPKSCRGIDILINKAGVIGPVGHLTDVSIDDWLHNIEVNLPSAVQAIQCVLPGMAGKRAGTIEAPSSGAAHKATGGDTAIEQLSCRHVGEVEGRGSRKSGRGPVCTVFGEGRRGDGSGRHRDPLRCGPRRPGPSCDSATWASGGIRARPLHGGGGRPYGGNGPHPDAEADFLRCRRFGREP